MPFVKESLDTLLQREDLSLRECAKQLSEIARSSGTKSSISFRTIGSWRSGERTPPAKHIDLLYLYAQSKGYYDLEFYQRPPV
jgi:hypothetical protein